MKFILDSAPSEFAEWMQDNFYYRIPDSITTAEDMQSASVLMSQIINAYSYIQTLAATLSIMTTNLKEECPSKPDEKNSDKMQEYLRKKGQYVAMSQKKKVVETQADILNKQYNCISRMVTIKLKSDEEIRMSDVRYGNIPGR